MLSPSAAQFLHAVQCRCVDRGLRLTPLRKLVLRVIVEANVPLTAYEVLERITQPGGITAPMSAYRALGFLTENGFLHRLASLGAYVACSLPQHDLAVPFLICERCAAVTEITNHHVAGLLASLAAERGFQPRAQTLEVVGICARCSRQGA